MSKFIPILLLLFSQNICADEVSILDQLVRKSPVIVCIRVISAENGTSITQLSTQFHIHGNVIEPLKGDLKTDQEVYISLLNLLRENDMNPIVVQPRGRYIAFLKPVYSLDQKTLIYHEIVNEPFGIPPESATFRNRVKRSIERLTEKN